MIDVELLLVDGPAAGRWVKADQYALRFHWRDPAALFPPLESIATYVPEGADLFAFKPWTPPTTEYRIRQVLDWDREVVHVGWCGGDQPNQAALWRWLSIPRPVKVISRGPELSYACDYAWRSDPVTGRIQGDCACGWRTEEMPSRYVGAVMDLVNEHCTESTNALTEHLFGLDPAGDISKRDRELLTVIKLVKWAEEDPEERIPIAVGRIFGPAST